MLMKMKSVELTMNIYSKMMFKKKNQITAHLKVTKLLKTFFFFLLLGRLWGKLQFLSVWRDYIKGARLDNAQKRCHWAYL